MNRQNVNLPKSKITDFCRQNHIRKLALFGSALRDDFRPDSDVDVLVEFDPGHVPGFLRLARPEVISIQIGCWFFLRFSHPEVQSKAEGRQEKSG